MEKLTKQYANVSIDASNKFELSCMTINVGSAGKRGDAEIRKLEVDKQSKLKGKKLTPADVRRNIFLNKIIDENPDIICFHR